jgi:hypothetical protein
MGQQAPLAIRDAPFGGADAVALTQNGALRSYHPCLGSDWPHQRNFEFEGRLADALLKS